MYRTNELAVRRGCDPSTIRKLAKTFGIGKKHGRDWLFTEEDAAELCELVHDGPGNPEWIKQGKDGGK